MVGTDLRGATTISETNLVALVLKAELLTPASLKIIGATSNPLNLDITGHPGMRVRIDAANTLTNWVPIATNTLPSSPQVYPDPRSANLPTRFYRTVTLPSQ